MRAFRFLVGEKLDKFGNSQTGRFAVERVHQANTRRTGRMPQRKIDSSRPAGVVADRDDLLKLQGVRDRFQVAELLFEGIDGALRLV